MVNKKGTVKDNLKLEKMEKIKGIAAKNIFNSPISPIQRQLVKNRLRESGITLAKN